MARMLGKVAWCCHPHDDYPVPRGTVRQREKRVTQKWLDEYESQGSGSVA